ncbi:MAG: IscS subfamily cysteine desulfurase [Planctomycetes bacterium]|nr:IscS subfamily cysteine desulfurase [Planctomycetota bacterium]
MPEDVIYMDHHATTPCARTVVEAMLPWFSERCGNAASRTHAYGWEAERAVDASRRSVRDAVGGDEVVFTSGATEAINLALFGLFEAERDRGGKRNRLVIQATEHKAVLDVARALERRGVEVVQLPVDAHGRVEVDAVDAALAGAWCVSVMAANNEIGTVQPVAEIGAKCREAGVPFHVDAAQAVGRLPVDVGAWSADLLSMSAHKVYGPKGVGALVLRRGGLRPKARMLGGGHESGLRSGTLNVPGIVGLGCALELAKSMLESEAERLTALRTRLWSGLQSSIRNVVLNGHPTERLPGNLSVSFRGVEGEALLLSLQDVVALSSGSACTSATVEPSHVLRALGHSTDLALATLRFGLGRGNTEAHVDRTLQAVVEQVGRLRARG